MHADPGIPLASEFFEESGKAKLSNEAFHGIAGEFVYRTLPETEADSTSLLASFLAASGVLFGKRGFGVVSGRNHPPTDFFLLVGKTGQGRKGTATHHALAVMNQVDADFERLRVIRGLSSGEGLVQKIVDRSKQMVLQDRRFLAVLPEFGGLLEVMTRQGNTLSYNMRQGWDGDPLHVSTRKDSLEISDIQLGVIGHVTADELLNGLTSVSYMNGFANRFLFFAVHRSQYLPEGGEQVDYSDIVRRLRQTVSNVASRGAALRRNQDAKKIWAQNYERLSTPAENLKGALCSRAEAHCLRLSVLYALLDDAVEVGAEHVRAALALWSHSETSVGQIFGAKLGDPDTQKILDALAGGPLNVTELMRVFGNNRSSEWLLAKLHSVEQKQQLIRCTKECNRKTTTAWRLK